MKTQRLVSRKCEYALRALFELARSHREVPVKIQEIAEPQGIPPRFLEAILVELKNGGFVLSKRGNSGGYVLAREAADIKVGEVIRLFQGRIGRTRQADEIAKDRMGDIAFAQLWRRTETAISAIYDRATFQGLLDEELACRSAGVQNYVI